MSFKDFLNEEIKIKNFKLNFDYKEEHPNPKTTSVYFRVVNTWEEVIEVRVNTKTSEVLKVLYWDDVMRGSQEVNGLKNDFQKLFDKKPVKNF